MPRKFVAQAVPLAVVGVLGLSVGGCAQPGPFPNINEAEGELYAALQALHRAPDRFGGHKAEAARLIREAMAELERAKADFR